MHSLPHINYSSHISAILDSILAALVFTIANARRLVARFLTMAWHSFIVWVTHRRYILIWNDAHVTYSHKIIDALKADLRGCHLYALQSPSELQNFYMGPNVISAIVLIDTDVSKFAGDTRESNQVERSLTDFSCAAAALSAPTT